MPAALQYYPPTEEGRKNLQQAVQLERQRRESRYKTALKYYMGEQPDQLTVEEDEPDHNTMINMVRMAADRTVSFVFPDIPKVKIDPKAIELTEDEKWIKAFLEANGGLPFLAKWALRGFLAGHTFLRVKDAKPYPKLLLLDPLAVSVFWRADDVSDVFWYENRYWVGNQLVIQDYVRTDEPDALGQNTWRIYTYQSKENPRLAQYTEQRPSNQRTYDTNFSALDSYNNFNGEAWDVVGSKSGAVHGSSIPPIIDAGHLPHPDDYYGLGEGYDNTRLQDDINRLASEINRIITLNSDPTDVITGADVDDVVPVDGVGSNVMTIANTAAKVARLEMKSDLSPINEMLQKRVETFLALSRVVLLKGEAKDLQRVTNASVRTLFLDALAKNKLLQASYGSALVSACRLALEMSKKVILDENPYIEFGSPLPVDETEIANVNAIQVNMGARSLQTAAVKIGDNPVFEQEAIQTETDRAVERQREQMELQQEFAPEPEEGKPAGNKPVGGGLTNKKPAP
jgi:hypothetical protein